ncbi:hypothetical protein [Actinoplanes sp. NPDC089786]|uniref:hypothetical protein n=1 Tax=Actinoplanes sp. NPDC089786 TaxID=3155185 RepID=UPI00341D4193
MPYQSNKHGDNFMQNIFKSKTVVVGFGSLAVAGVIITALLLFGSSIPAAASEVWSAITADVTDDPTPGTKEKSGGWAPPAFKQPARAEVSLSPSSGPKGARIKVSGRNFEPGESVSIEVHMFEAAVVTANSEGSFSTRITIPPDTFCPQGQCTVTASGNSSIKWNNARYTIS